MRFSDIIALYTPKMLPGGYPVWNRSTVLSCIEGTSDKVYHLEIVHVATAYDHEDEYCVNVKYGRRGGTMTSGTKTPVPVSLVAADHIYKKTLAEKIAKGYTE